MGTEALPVRQNGSSVDETWFNKIKAAFIGVFSPRNTTTYDCESAAGSMGTSSFRWRRAYIKSGYFAPGMLKNKYIYSGSGIPLDRGWMLCDGRQVNQANYDIEHGAGAWVADEVSTSLLVNKYLPDMTGRFVRGTTGSTQTGAAPITTVGQASFDMSHNHGSGTVTTGTANPIYGTGPVAGAGNAYVGDHTHDVTVDALSQTVTNGPESIELHHYMRVV